MQITPNVSTKVGTADDFRTMYNAIRCSGIIRVSATIGSVYMDGGDCYVLVSITELS